MENFVLSRSAGPCFLIEFPDNENRRVKESVKSVSSFPIQFKHALAVVIRDTREPRELGEAIGPKDPRIVHRPV
jgi:hypothetical protein